MLHQILQYLHVIVRGFSSSRNTLHPFHLSIILTFACHGCEPASDVCKEEHCWPFDCLFLLFVLHVESTNVSNDVTISTLWIISLGQNPRRSINRLDSMNISWVFPHIMPNCSPKGLCQL